MRNKFKFFAPLAFKKIRLMLNSLHLNTFLKNKISLFIFLLLLLASCDVLKKSSPSVNNVMPVVELDTIVKVGSIPVYRASKTRINDIIHTKLDVKFDWEKTFLLGKATITVKPYFYPVKTLSLDAKGMDIHSVSLLLGDSVKKTLEYSYEKDELLIKLDKEYNKDEIYSVYIDYTAKPNERRPGGSDAIKEDKGLYFINPQGKDKDKPKEIWTQGETESNSCWFPTIDSPNERMTDEIYITVDKKYETLSNGELAFSTENSDGTRTDLWKMDLPHAPYLVMMAIGEFSIVHDKWHDKDVSYYVEPKYAPYAKAIFGNTPEMMEFYSNKLGVAFPWNKYAQVVVRDYISGAMENTSATLHGEFLQQTSREMLDRNFEDVISHELFHQWFGDLVTCESWSNIPLNESFATYGEYLWTEYKYGRDKADQHLQNDLNKYLQEAEKKQVNLIRFYYDENEDMFDSHSYSKGGRVLHMLRKYVGDEAFFASLKLYLETNKFNSVEIHDLRFAFEKVTGEDLNWFFNQWFLSSGHPTLSVNSVYNKESKKQTISVYQVQDLKNTPMFKIPLAIDIYVNGLKQGHNIVVSKFMEEFVFDVASEPDLVNFDAEKILLGILQETKSTQQWVFQFLHAPLYLDRYDAIRALGDQLQDSLAKATIIKALDDNSWAIRQLAMAKLNKIPDILPKEKLMVMALQDKKAALRALSISYLSKNFKDENLISIYKSGLRDSAYSVVSASLEAISKSSPLESVKLAKEFEKEENESLYLAIASIYSQHGTEDQNDFFSHGINRFHGFNKIAFINLYIQFLKHRDDQAIDTALSAFEDVARNGNTDWLRFYGQRAISDLADIYLERKTKQLDKIKGMKLANSTDPELPAQQEILEKYKSQEKKINDLLMKVQKAEKN